MPAPECRRCERPMQQPGRYEDWRCACCDVSARCPHVSFITRMTRRFFGRRT